MNFRLKRIPVALTSMWRYLLHGYWPGNSLWKCWRMFCASLGGLLMCIVVTLFFPIYALIDILFCIFIAPFMKGVDQFEEK